MTTAAEMLTTAACVVRARGAVYGDPVAMWSDVARRWSDTLGTVVTPEQALLCMIELKMARLRRDGGHDDSVVDIAGYAACLAEVISARTGS